MEFSPCALVLAAGAGRRMGGPKALLDFKGRSFLERVLDVLPQEDFPWRVVVLDPRSNIFEKASALACSKGALVAENQNADQGMLSSIRAGLAVVPVEASHIAVQPVDHPGVLASTVQTVRLAAGKNPDSIVVPSFQNRRGHPGFFPREFFPELLAARDEEGARALLQRHPQRILHVLVEDPAAVRDIDTPSDL